MREQVIALTGVWQALDLVHQLASKGELEAPQRKRFDATIESLFIRLDSPSGSAARVFGGLQNLEYAFHGLAYQLEQPGKRQQTMSYFVQVIGLQKRLAGDRRLTAQIAECLDELHHQQSYFSSDNPQLIINLADVYLQTMGKLPTSKRIRIYGKERFLQTARVQQSVRALLLAALRAAMLWQQVGGSRLLLVFQRKRILQELYQLSNE